MTDFETPPDSVGAMRRREWHLDRRVTLALIVGLLLQAGSIVYWAAGVEGRVNSNAEDVVELKSDVSAMQQIQTTAAVDTARLDERLKGIEAGVKSIERLLQTLARSGHDPRQR